MKKPYILIFAVMASILSCTPKMIPLKGNYQPVKTETDKSFSEVWDKTIDIFTEKGLPIKIIDRSSGLIISQQIILKVTSEDKNGVIKDSNADIVVPAAYDWGKNKYVSVADNSTIVGEWNVRIKEVNGKRSISINIVNVKCEVSYKGSIFLTASDYASTGRFEKGFTDLILN